MALNPIVFTERVVRSFLHYTINSAIFTAPEQCLDFIVVAQERDEKVGGPVLEDKTQRESGATLKQLVTQFANAKAAVGVGSTEAFSQLAQS